MCNQNTLKQITDKVCGYSKVVFGQKLSAVKLYGSYARGDFDDESDIDIIIIADISPEERVSYRNQIFDYIYDLNLEYGVLLSIFIQDKSTFERYKDSYPFYKNIESEGVDLVA